MPSRPVISSRAARMAEIGFRLLDAALATVFLAMIVLVFTNVILRYLFDSGISVTDEISRMMFVWITFLGAVCVARRNGHLGVDLVTVMLPQNGRRICRMLTDVIIIVCCIVLSVGAWEQTMFNMGNLAPVSGIPTAINYFAPFVCGVCIGIVAVFDLIAAAMGGPKPDHEEGHTA